ncbi:uncharacterized protein PAF06_002068 [Gastrophryne carolinensis]
MTVDRGTNSDYPQDVKDEEVTNHIKEENLNIVVVDMPPDVGRSEEMGMRMEDMEMHSDVRIPYVRSTRKGYIRRPYRKWWSPAKNIVAAAHKMKYVRRRMPSECIMNPEFLKEFITMYHSFPCLWNIKFADYSNKQKRTKAYEQLALLCRKVCPTANVQFVKHKIANLRTVFKKEYNKVEQSRRTAVSEADVYVPRLWYYDLLKFTCLQDMPGEPSSIVIPAARNHLNLPDVSDMLDDEDPHMEEATGKEGPKEETLEESTNVSQVTSNSQSDDVEFEVHDEIMATIRRQRKRKMYSAHSEEEIGERLLTQATALLTKNDDEYDAFGIMVSSKLRKMDDQQRLLAEVLIMDVLYKGFINQLNEESFITPYPGQDFQNQPSS